MLRRWGLVLGAAATTVLFACSDDAPSDDLSSNDDTGIDASAGPDGGGGGGETDGAKPNASGPMLVISAPSPLPSSNLCSAFSLRFVDESKGATVFPNDENVSITSDALTKVFATEQACKSGAPPSPSPSPVPVTKGAASQTFYVRTDAEGSVTLTATASFATGTLSFTPTDFHVLGQPDTRTVQQVARSMFGAQNVFIQGGKLFVRSQGRIRVWNSWASSDDAPSLVLGAATFSSTKGTFGDGGGIWTDGTRLVVTDSENHRVLVWTKFPTKNGEAPSFALGQPAGADNLTSTTENNGGISGSSMYLPSGVMSDSTRLFVTDSANNRVLVWNTFPTMGGQSASYAIGQPAGANNLTSRDSPFQVTGAILLSPKGIAIAGTKLVVVDWGHHRVLVWKDFTAAGAGSSADFALGAPAGPTNLTETYSDNNLVSGNNLFHPTLVTTDGTRLVVEDGNHHRVLVWPTFPTTGGEPASFALGQPAGPDNLTTQILDSQHPSGSTVEFVYGVAVGDGKLVVSDGNLSRVLVWNTFPTMGGQSASYAMGQPSGPANLTSKGSFNFTPQPLAFGASNVASDGTHLFVADYLGNRVLVWNVMPTSSTTPPSFALGQPAGAANLTSSEANNGGVSGSSMKTPFSVYSDGVRLYVADSGNHRVLVWNTIPTSGGQSADFALGQPTGAANLTSNAANDGGAASGGTMSLPVSITKAGTRLFIADSGNNRVLAWNTIPTTGGQAADFALGHPAGAANLTSNGANDSGPSGASLSVPYSVAAAGARLYVADYANSRVLVWTTIPTTGGAAADFALGQPAGASNLTAVAPINGGLSASSLAYPMSVATDGKSVFVTDAYARRVIGWSTAPTAGGEPANLLYGSKSFTDSEQPSSEPSASNFDPLGIYVEPTRLFVADQSAFRVLILGR